MGLETRLRDESVVEQDCALSSGVISFGSFTLDFANRTLSQAGLPVRIRERELSILIYLAARAGTFVPRDELIFAIWAEAKVSDANLRVQVAALKRLLGNGRHRQEFVRFSSGQGYMFRGGSADPPLLEGALPQEPKRAGSTPTPASARPHNIPIRIKPFYGREEELNRLVIHLPLHRLVTIVGAGGIGKTTLALASAEAMIDAYENGIRLVDLAGLSDPRLVSATVAMALNTSLLSDDPIDDLVKFLRDKQILILLDNCEHMIEEVATLVESILTRTRDVHFLTTSREPLRVDSEWLFRLGPLDVPPRYNGLSALESLIYPTVKLFVERVRLSDDQFELADPDALAVADLCRRLDGNPLAVELAAARVGLFGIQGLAEQLAQNFSTLTQGRRTALPRHQTLRATLDWSYDILAERERRLLARLAIFRGEFTLASAQAVAGLPADDIVNGLAELTAKSLVNVNAACHPAQYRMLFITRDYAREKLMACGEFDLVARRHATTYLSLLQLSGSEISKDVSDTWIDDVRSALTWTLGETGDFEIAMELVTASFGTALRIASLHERGMLLDIAAARIRSIGKRYPIFELRMLVERVSVLQFSENKEAAMPAIAEMAMQLAEEIRADQGDIMPLVEMLITKISIYFGEANVPEMKRHIQMIRTLPLTDEQRRKTALTLERMEFQAEYFAGDFVKSQSRIEKILNYPPEVLRTRHFTIADFISPSITGRIFLSRIQWVRGASDAAARTADDTLALASTLNAIVQCYVLAFSVIPIAIWRGQGIRARELVQRLAATSNTSSLIYWQTWVPFYEAVLDGCFSEAAEPEFCEFLSAAAVNPMQLDLLPTLVMCAPSASIERLNAGYVGWNGPEIYRLQGEQYFRKGDIQSAARFFQLSLKCAREQSALSWELRAATSLATLLARQDRATEANGLLSGVIRQFHEGLQDADLVKANRLLHGIAV